jgi:hypothetical protein
LVYEEKNLGTLGIISRYADCDVVPSIIDKIKEEEERRQEVDKKNLECKKAKNTVKNLGFNPLMPVGMLF